ncbi:MAG: formate dehydrogenase accessory sulfurtransferase FdhD [Flavobacteriales bacterium]|nr:formate dehydrogenase accessory sulfurtransferase FdhD [Flavobacteriales bacterium]
MEVTSGSSIGSYPELGPELVQALPERMRAAQTMFKHTGGIHAAALFKAGSSCYCARISVGITPWTKWSVRCFNGRSHQMTRSWSSAGVQDSSWCRSVQSLACRS